ncbi:hypothetical protein RUND412_004829 [Rhizina undulata]
MKSCFIFIVGLSAGVLALPQYYDPIGFFGADFAPELAYPPNYPDQQVAYPPAPPVDYAAAPVEVVPNVPAPPQPNFVIPPPFYGGSANNDPYGLAYFNAPRKGESAVEKAPEPEVTTAAASAAPATPPATAAPPAPSTPAPVQSAAPISLPALKYSAPPTEAVNNEFDDNAIRYHVNVGGVQTGNGRGGATNFHVFTDENGNKKFSEELDPETEKYIKENMLPKLSGKRKKGQGGIWSVFGP